MRIGLGDLEALHLRGAGGEIENVRARSDDTTQGDITSSSRIEIDRRVRHLRKVLLEVGVAAASPSEDQRRQIGVSLPPSSRSLPRRLAPIGVDEELQALLPCSRRPAGRSSRFTEFVFGEGGRLLRRQRQVRTTMIWVRLHPGRHTDTSAANFEFFTSSSSEMMRPFSRSMSSILPGCRRHLLDDVAPRRSGSTPDSDDDDDHGRPSSRGSARGAGHCGRAWHRSAVRR